MSLTHSPAWLALQAHFNETKEIKMADLFVDDKLRAETFSLTAAGLFLDYSKNRMTFETREKLVDLANASDLKQHIQQLFSGEAVNFTEQRPAWHTQLRAPLSVPEIKQSLKKMRQFINSIYNGSWQGYTEQVITDVVNIGIGGSDLGPRLVVDALKPYWQKKVNVHFVANIDGTDIHDTLTQLNPGTTLFIIASKSFTTIETLTNANTAREWFLAAAHDEAFISQHFIAVSANPSRALEFGICEANVFDFWDWVGGRFSLWSAIGLPIAMAIGMDNFQGLLNGAHQMDEHFKTAPFESNMPVIMATLGIWYNNFYHCHTQAVIPYDEHLQLLPAYLQQLDMESNGKSVNKRAEFIDYPTAPILWGGVGSNGQHAFHQLLHQSRRIIPVDFIMAANNHHPYKKQHELLKINCLAQSQAMLYGLTAQQAFYELIAKGMNEDEAKRMAMFKSVPGNKPSNTLTFDTLTPEVMGSLIALYEHKVFVQGVIWEINSFDQYGVELGKQLATDLMRAEDKKLLNASTRQLLKKLNEANL
jgi:glucose-6-phosphate isomerase